MEHRWFKDVDWAKVIKKDIKPPLVPDINLSYFEPDRGDSEVDESGTQLTPNGLHEATVVTKSNLRRVSYYMHSTVHMPSCIDERTSFIR